MFYTYILQSQKDSSFYIGYSSNIQNRLFKHNNAKSGYTSTKKPWILVYFEEFETKTEAIKRENEIKKKKSKDFILNLIQDWTGSSGG